MNLTFLAQFYTTGGLPATGETIGYAVYNAAQPAGAAPLASGTATETAAPGVYRADYSSAGDGDFVCVFTGSGLAMEYIPVADPYRRIYDDLDTVLALLGPMGGAVREVSAQVYLTGTTTAIPNPIIDVRAGGAVATILRGAVAGTATLRLEDGIYQVRLYAPGYSFGSNNLTVSGDGSVIWYGDALTIPPPANPALCRLYVWLGMPDLSIPVASHVQRARLTVTVDGTGDTELYNGPVAGVYDTVNGILYWDVRRGATVLVNIPKFMENHSVVVPDSAIYNLVQ